MGVHTVGNSFRARLAVGYAVVAVAFAATWLWSLYGPLTEAALTQQTTALTAVARSAALVVADSSEDPATTAERLVAGSDLRLTIVDARGVVLADSSANPATMENHADRPEIAAALSGQTGVDRRKSRTEGRAELYVAVPSSVAKEPVAVRVSQPLANIEAAVARSRRVGLALLGIALAAAFVIAGRASALAARPIERLSIAASRMAGGDLGTPVPSVPREMQPLAAGLETLASQVRRQLADLEAEQRTLRTVLDGLDDAVLLLDGDTVRYANAAASERFHTPARGWRGTRLADTGLPASLTGQLVALAGADRPASLDLGPDPFGRFLRVTVVPLEPTELGPQVLAVISDVSERMRTDAVRRDFVANASHELKTPVAGIRLLADSAATAASDGDIDQSLAFSRQIAAESSRLQRLVTDLLDLSRLESAPEPGRVADVRAAVENTLLGHRSTAARKGIVLAVDADAVEGIDLFALADPTDLAIALDNLVDNALAYTESGTVTLGLGADAERVHIAVSDTGPGIPPEHLPRIFERFYRVDRGRSRESGGTGLGLALVRHVVERSGGAIRVQSEPGSGSTFTVELPRASWGSQSRVRPHDGPAGL